MIDFVRKNKFSQVKAFEKFVRKISLVISTKGKLACNFKNIYLQKTKGT